jgi:pilus assembly protein CpaE
MIDETELRGRIDPIRTDAAYPRMQANSTTILICPNEGHLRMLTRALEAQRSSTVEALRSYPNYNAVLSLADADCDAILIEADTDSDAAMDVVEAICARKPSVTVMVYATTTNPGLLMSSMRAGAREFLSGAIAPEVLADALLRAAARRAEAGVKKTQAKVFLFWGAKGGSGVTTLATNFAIALQRETGGRVALADLHPQLGDIAVLLGVTPRFTISDALTSPQRLDEEFVGSLMTEHKSGVSVLAAPDSYSLPAAADGRAVGKLVELAGNQFPYVVIDAGPGLGLASEALFRMAATVYLVTQADIPSLRNSQRLLAYLKNFSGISVELVLNRFEPRKMEFDEERLSKAVGMAPKWKVPNDYAAARSAANAGTPLVLEKSAIAEVLHQMARAASGKPPGSEKKKRFSLFG